MVEAVSPPTYLEGVVTVSTHPYIGLVSVSASAASPQTHTTEMWWRPARASPVPTIKRKTLLSSSETSRRR